MNPFAQLIAPAAFAARRAPATGSVLTVKDGLRIDPPGHHEARKAVDAAMKQAKAKAITGKELAEAKELKRQLQRERNKAWHRERYAKRRLDPAYMAQKRERERARLQDPEKLRAHREWEAKNAESRRAYKRAWAQMRKANETPEEHAKRRAAQRQTERAYYNANRERILAQAKERRLRKLEAAQP